MHSGEAIDTQDIRNMGGLRRKMPVTFWTFLIGGLALSGFPLITAGFWSKDEILTGAFASDNRVVFLALALAALFTAIYSARQIMLVFLGTARTKSAEHAGENKTVMTLPLIVLAVFAVSAGWIGIPHAFPVLGQFSNGWLQTFIGSMLPMEEIVEGHSVIPLVTSIIMSLGGLLIGWRLYRKFQDAAQTDPLQRGLGPSFNLMQNKYWMDEVYDFIFIRPSKWFAEKVSYQFLDNRIIDGALHGIGRFGIWLGKLFRFGFDLPVVNGAGDGTARGTKWSGQMLRKLQNGKVQHYMGLAVLLMVLAGIIVIYFVVAL
jgi:NADH-quinone oxidoreductase subunit L